MAYGEDGSTRFPPAAVASPLGRDPSAALAGWKRYEVGELLGTGGMGAVYRAWDPRLRRAVALKLLTRPDPEQAARLLREARAQARLEHPHVCRVFEVGEAAGMPYIAMELVDGLPLDDVAADLRLEEKVLVARLVAEGLHAAHRAGLVHRDVKPANVMVARGEDGALRPVVVDFGIARDLAADGMTVAGSAVGTPAFMAPEQARGEAARVDRRTDVWALGATLYAVIAGRPVYSGASLLEVLRMAADQEAPALRAHVPSIPADLEAIVMKCLEREPERRYDSARALADDLGRFLDGRPVAARPVGPAARALRWARRNRAVAALGGAALLATLLLGGLWAAERATAARRGELAQRFGQRVAAAEGILWREESLELHDIRPARERLRRELAAIEAETGRLGRLAEGPGHAAIGRGLLALEAWDEARRHLEHAWAAGHRAPESAYDLGLALGRIYQRELGALARLRAPADREARKAEIEASLRDPALSWLRLAAGAAGVSPAYVEALVASNEGRAEETIARARGAFAALPWLWEAKVLESDALLRQARDRQRAGEYEAALAVLTEARAAAARAARIAESAPLPRRASCVLERTVMQLEVWALGRGSEATLARLEESCAAALAVDPGQAAVHNALAEGRLSWGRHLTERGGDPAPVLAGAIAAAREATRLAPEDDMMWRTLGLAWWQCGASEGARDLDPTAALTEAARAAGEAVRLHPRNVYALGDLGLIEQDLAAFRIAHGGDARGPLERSLAAFDAALAVTPDLQETLASAGGSASALLRLRRQAGERDLAALAEKGLAFLDRALAHNPRNALAAMNRGALRTELALAALDAGEDAAPALGRALADLETAVALNPDSPFPLAFLARGRAAEARLARERGESPVAALAAARAAVAGALRTDPVNTVARETAAELARLAPGPPRG